MEAVLLSTPITFLKVEVGKKNKGAMNMMKLKEKIDLPLSAILSLNTIAHTVGAAGVGAQATIVFGEVYFGLVSGVLTILILVFTEIIPKTIGARFWKYLIGISSLIINVMIWITYPLVLLSSYITRLITDKPTGSFISREEISALANIGTEEGIFGEKENLIIQNLIRLKNVKVYEIMTPRVVISSADQKMSLEEFLKGKEFLRFSRIPVYSDNEEQITGYVIRQNVFEKLAEDNTNLTLNDIKREILFVPRNQPAFKVWEKMIEKKEHIALVIDEYGGTDGIVTMEDIIETLVGFEIVDEKDTIPDMQQYARERWRMRQEKYNIMNLNGKEGK